jgi:hypothetical protein
MRALAFGPRSGHRPRSPAVALPPTVPCTLFLEASLNATRQPLVQRSTGAGGVHAQKLELPHGNAPCQ